jgi:hypothetical protein
LRKQLKIPITERLFTETYRSTALTAGAVVLGVLALSSIAMTLIGVAKSWSALPFWDMWDGEVTWFFNLDPGNIVQWWAQHNEHRILLARIFFYVDMRIFQGSGGFLLISNIAAMLVLISLLLLGLLMRLREGAELRRPLATIVFPASVVTILASSWIQNSNLLWGFQIQFWLVYIFPLAMFLLLAHLLVLRPQSLRRKFLEYLAVLSLVGAVLSMSNGLVAAWIGVLFVFLYGFRKRLRIMFVSTSTILTGLYLWDYVTPGSHVSPFQTLLHHPLSAVEYFLAYLGGPIQFFTGKSTLAVAAGFAVFLVFVTITFYFFKKGRAHPVAFALVAFSAFIVSSAVMTSLARASFGTDQAFASRYQTPVLALWATLIIVVAPAAMPYVRRWPLAATVTVLLGSLLALPQQIVGAQGDNTLRASRELATIALANDVIDTDVLGTVYYDMPRLVELNNEVKAAGLTLLAAPPYASMASQLGTTRLGLKPVNCDGWFDTSAHIVGSTALRVSGWVVGPEFPVSGFGTYSLIDERDHITGYLSRGVNRSDLLDAFGPEWAQSGFSGYVIGATLPTSTYISGDGWKCSLPLNASDAVLTIGR